MPAATAAGIDCLLFFFYVKNPAQQKSQKFRTLKDNYFHNANLLLCSAPDECYTQHDDDDRYNKQHQASWAKTRDNQPESECNRIPGRKTIVPAPHSAHHLTLK